MCHRYNTYYIIINKLKITRKYNVNINNLKSINLFTKQQCAVMKFQGATYDYDALNHKSFVF